jgi:hypothetical protein
MPRRRYKGSTTDPLGKLKIEDNRLLSRLTNDNIVVDPDGTGKVVSNDITILEAGTGSSASNNGTLVTSGGINVSEDLYVNGTLNAAGLDDLPIGSVTPASASFSSLTVNGTLTTAETSEDTTSISGASGTVTHDYNTANTFIHSSISGNFTANFTNVPTTDNQTITMTLVLNQGNTPRYANAVQINGASETILWTGYEVPNPQPNKTEFQIFNLIRSGSAWKVTAQFLSAGAVLDGTTAAKAAPSASAIIETTGVAASGYYWIAPAGNGPYYVYCDQTTDGGGWMMLINVRPSNGGQYYGNNDYGLSTVNGNAGTPEHNKSTTSMFGRTKINHFFQMPGYKYGRLTPNGASLSGGMTGLYQRIGTTTTAQWGGSLFDCGNRGSLTNSTYNWVLTQYKNWSDVQSGNDQQVGTYTGGNHYYPTTYAGSYQHFYKGDQDGIRFSSDGFRGNNYSSVGQNTVAGYYWIKV